MEKKKKISIYGESCDAGTTLPKAEMLDANSQHILDSKYLHKCQTDKDQETSRDNSDEISG